MVAIPDLRLDISLFDSAWDRVPKAKTVTLRGLVAALSTFRACEGVTDKRGLPAWSPARFAEGSTRRAEAVQALSCIVLDLDGGSIERVSAAWADALHVLHSTWSHVENAPRFRLVVPPARSRWAVGPRRGRGRSRGRRRRTRPARTPGGSTSSRRCGTTNTRGSPGSTSPVCSMSSSVPVRLRDRLVRRRLGHDPGTRERVALAVGARIAGAGGDRRAEGAACPGCGRRSVWFWLAPRRLRKACCHHRRTCGWSGFLDELLAAGAP